LAAGIEAPTKTSPVGGRSRNVRELELENVRSDLYYYLRTKNDLFSSEFGKVVADAATFTEAVARHGVEVVFGLAAHANVQPDRPFMEVAEALVDHQIRFVRQRDRDLVRKSMLEAYIYIAGPRYVLEPVRKTRFVQSLRRSEPKKFAALLFYLHLYNLISALIQDDLRTRVSNVKSFQLYLLKVETICRDIVKEAVKVPGVITDESWTTEVIRNVERQLHPPFIPTKSRNLLMGTGLRK
jgi:hypothetical protein